MLKTIFKTKTKPNGEFIRAPLPIIGGDEGYTIAEALLTAMVALSNLPDAHVAQIKAIKDIFDGQYLGRGLTAIMLRDAKRRFGKDAVLRIADVLTAEIVPFPTKR